MAVARGDPVDDQIVEDCGVPAQGFIEVVAAGGIELQGQHVERDRDIGHRIAVLVLHRQKDGVRPLGNRADEVRLVGVGPAESRRGIGKRHCPEWLADRQIDQSAVAVDPLADRVDEGKERL